MADSSRSQPEEMRAWRVEELGDPGSVLQLQELPAPVPADGQVLVDVLAAGVGFTDVLMCQGRYQVRPDLPFTPGSEVCGRVRAVGAGVSARVGDLVLGATQLPHGGFAEQTVMNAESAFPVPHGLSPEQAGGFYVAHQTAWFALVHRARLQPDETVLVHAAAGGVGSATVQVAKALGARVVGVVGGTAKTRFADALGADVVIDRHEADFVEIVNSLTDGRGADVIIDPVGGETYTRSTKCIAFEGRLVLVGFAGGQVQTAPLNHPLVKNYSILGLHLGLYRQRRPEVIGEGYAALSRLVSESRLAPLVGERAGLGGAADLTAQLADGRIVGRAVIVPGLGVGPARPASSRCADRSSRDRPSPHARGPS